MCLLYILLNPILRSEYEPQIPVLLLSTIKLNTDGSTPMKKNYI